MRKSPARLCPVGFLRLLLIGIWLGLAGPVLPAWAQEDPISVLPVLFVNFDALFQDSLVAQDINRQVMQQIEDLSVQFEAKQKALNKAAQTIADEKSNLSPDQLAQRIQDLQNRTLAEQQWLVQQRQAIDGGMRRAHDLIRKVLKPILAALLNEKQAIMLLDERAVLVGAAEQDITQEVMDRLNRALINVAVGPVAASQ